LTLGRPVLTPGRTLETHPHHEPDRERLCHGAQPQAKNQGLPEPQDRPRHGFQADDVSKEKVAQYLRTNRLPKVIQGVEFKDGIKQLQTAPDHAVTNFWA